LNTINIIPVGFVETLESFCYQNIM